MKDILITGGAGFVGANLTLELQNRFPEARITVLDDFRVGKFKNLLGFKGDCLAYNVAGQDWLPWAKTQNWDHIFHLASITDTTVLDECKMMNENIEGFRNILELASEKKASVVWASSAATYGNVDKPVREEDAGAPNNIYGFSKWVMEGLARKYFGKVKKVVGLRYFNVFGPGEYYKGHAASMIYQLTVQIMAGKSPRIFKDGEQKRDHIYVKDVVAATIQAHQSKENTVLNLGTGTATSFNAVISAINEALGTDVKPEFFENPFSFYQNFTQADMSRHKAMTGFTCKYTTREGIIDYVRNHLLKRPLAEMKIKTIENRDYSPQPTGIKG
ncbi:MAG TPA: ADP-glyceromanno-heptose 6-epimerase [Candidatus Omnitrophota bacterium]|nr:ADP-glyceromanno-heptose 6-epimerase [Candidatus Omnitrophota bacterium]HRK61961.1 ADP-glyceromanno-heptose 6-epimerase [Candidatus Omnitrophota bacterium]